MWSSNHVILLLILLMLVAVFAEGKEKPACHPVCSCSSKSVQCTCAQPTDSLEITPDYFSHGSSKEFVMYLSKCDTVRIKSSPKPAKKIKVKEIKIDMVREVALEDYAFQQVGHMAKFVVSNVEHLDINKKTFFGIDSGINSMELTNVGLTKLVYDSTHGSHLQSLNLMNCKIDMIDDGDFKMGTSMVLNQRIKMVDTRIGKIYTNGLKVEEIDFISLHSCHIKKIDTNGFNLKSIAFFEVENSTIGEIDTDAFSKGSIGKFIFKNNVIGRMNKEALYGLNITEGFKFRMNRVERADELSVLPRKFVKPKPCDCIEMMVDDNKFSCYCQIRWMWDYDTYEEVLKQNVCFEPQEDVGKSLNSLKPILDRCPIIDKDGNVRTTAYSTDEAASWMTSPLTILFYLITLVFTLF